MRWQSLSIKLMAAAVAFLVLSCTRNHQVNFSMGNNLLNREGNVVRSVSAGEMAFIRVDVKPDQPDLEYRWELLRIEKGEKGIQGTKENVGEFGTPSELKGPEGYYQAPEQPGIINMTLIVLHKGEELGRKSFPLEIVAKATPEGREVANSTPSPREEEEIASEEVQPTPSAREKRTTPTPPFPERERRAQVPRTPAPSTSQPSVSISQPKEGERVSHMITVRGRVRKPESEYLTIVVRPIPDDPGQFWWVQSRPQILSDGTWASSPVFIGLPDDPPGLPFRICAVITSEQLYRGKQLPEPPSGPSFCTDVRRK